MSENIKRFAYVCHLVMAMVLVVALAYPTLCRAEGNQPQICDDYRQFVGGLAEGIPAFTLLCCCLLVLAPLGAFVLSIPYWRPGTRDWWQMILSVLLAIVLLVLLLGICAASFSGGRNPLGALVELTVLAYLAAVFVYPFWLFARVIAEDTRWR